MYIHIHMFICWCLVAESCPTLCNSMDYSLSGSFVHGFPRQECWSELPFPPPGDLPYPGIKPASPALAGRFFTTGGSDGKASAYNVGDLGSIPGSGRSSGEGNGSPLQYSCLENPMDGGAW